MSVFDLPRVHFAGIGVTRLPTGPRSGLLDLATHAAVRDSTPFPAQQPAPDYHDYLDRQGFRFEPDGTVTPDGRFGSVKGWNFGGNGHFWVDARVVGTELRPGLVDSTDALVGRQVDIWGHYNDYLATTSNRARVFDVDPASNWTTAVLCGQFSLGRDGRSHDVGYLLTGQVHDVSAPRWLDFRHVLEPGEHPLAREFSRSVVYQFVVAEDDRIDWLGDLAGSPGLAALREALAGDEFGGLVVQFALSNMATPMTNNAPDRWDLRGTIAPWRTSEMRTYPAGRLLSGDSQSPLRNLTVGLSDQHVTLNAVNAVPVVSRAPAGGPGPTHRLGSRLDLGDLELRTESGRLLANFPRTAYLDESYGLTSGVLSAPRADRERDDPTESLRLCTQDGEVLLAEREINVQTDQASLFLEHPDTRNGRDFPVEVTLRSFVRGRPSSVDRIAVHQFFNQRALPLDPLATRESAAATDIALVEMTDRETDYSTTCVVSTDDTGQARLSLRASRAGGAKILFVPPGESPPCDPDAAGSAAVGYDNDDRLGYWSSAGYAAVRVLPDHWYLDAVPDDEVTFDLVYREVFAYFELMYSFMTAEVMSLADPSKVATFARIIWLMCDPVHKGRSFYMPSTRDLTAPQANLLLRWCRITEDARQTPPQLVLEKPRTGVITTRDELCAALRKAATIELAVMLQYLYALWSIPTYSAGVRYVERGEWTPEQLQLMCGEGPHSQEGGIRGSLFGVAREEMMHFLVINNIIMATGQPFHLPAIDFGTVNSELPVPLDFCLEAFGRGSLQRFIELEKPYSTVQDIAGNEAPPTGRNGAPHPYGSLSELYAAIREALQVIPGLFMVEKNRGGGEHHLFMRESLNVTHPDYQLEVDDVASAVFAIDFVTEHGEGNVIESVLPEEESHYDTFLRVAEALAAEYTTGPGGRRVPWDPAYPVMRNPTLRQGDSARDPVTNEQARAAIDVFNRSYAMTMQLMAQHFGISPDKSLRRSRLVNAALDLMTGVLRPLGEYIVTLPSGRPGRTAGPTFELDRDIPVISRADVAARWASTQFAALSADAGKLPGLHPAVAQLLAHVSEQFATIDPQEL